MNSTPNIHLIGLGGIGAAYASMAQDAGLHFSIICDAERKERYAKNGFIINGKSYQFDYVTEVNETVDLILIVVKGGQLNEAIEAITPYVSTNTIIMSLLNGITSEDIIMKKLNTKNVVHAFSMATDAVRNGNIINYTSKGKIVYGHHRSKQQSLAEKVEKYLAQSSINTERVDNIEYRQWWKFMSNVGINQVSTLLRCDYAPFQCESEARTLARQAMQEVIAIAQQQNIPLTEQDMAFTFEIMERMSPSGKTSMLQDIEARRTSEVDIFAGEMMRLGQQYNIPTPVNEVLYHAINYFDKKNDDIKKGA